MASWCTFQASERAMDQPLPIVVIGGGHAAAQLCASLATFDLAVRIHLVSEERELPYHRPPLSKGFLADEKPQLLHLRSAEWYDRAGVTVHLGETASSIGLKEENPEVRLSSGKTLPASWVVIATGTKPRVLAQLADGIFSNVSMLRSDQDARELRQRLGLAERVVVIGGGYIGLEVAATAAKLGKKVTLLEAAPRLMNRSASQPVADHVAQAHRALGVDLRLGVGPLEVETDGTKVIAMRCEDEQFAADLFVVGVGASPRTDLAAEAGLKCDNGILVDAQMRTSDPRVLAIGDCAREYQGAHGGLRLESVHCATEHAKVAAATIAAAPPPPRTAPWFWSDQASLKLQIVGLVPPAQTQGHVMVRRPGKTADSFSVAHFVDGVLVSVESVNCAVDHMQSRKLLDAGLSPTPADFSDPLFSMKAWTAAQPHAPETNQKSKDLANGNYR